MKFGEIYLVGVRIKLFDDDIKDTDIDPKPQKSVHWSTEGRPSGDFHFDFHSNNAIIQIAGTTYCDCFKNTVLRLLYS